MTILNGDGRMFGDGEIGEIVIRGDVVMKQYWNGRGLTDESLAGDQLQTGDVGYREADGFCFAHDWIIDIIVTGGENADLAKDGRAITGCLGAAVVAVIGVPDDLRGRWSRCWL